MKSSVTRTSYNAARSVYDHTKITAIHNSKDLVNVRRVIHFTGALHGCLRDDGGEGAEGRDGMSGYFAHSARGCTPSRDTVYETHLGATRGMRVRF